MKDGYEFIAKAINPYTDIFLCETLSTIRDVKVSTSVCAQYNKPIWVALHIKDAETLSSGEPIKDLIDQVKDTPNLEAMMINCVNPDVITDALKNLK